MRYTHLGTTGLLVSRFSLGAMTFGTGQLVPGVTNAIDQTKADDMIALALERGINLFDTADMYTGGQSEQMLGKALGGRRDEVLIATKCGFRSAPALNARGASSRYLRQAVEGSLTRLGTDYVDLFFVHIPDPWTPAEQTLRALEDLTREGKIRCAGLSNFPAWQAQKVLGLQREHGWAPIQALQMYYSLLGRDIEAEVVPLVEDAGLGLMSWSPLASGYLTGKYTGGSDAEGRRRSFDFPPVDTELGDRTVAALREIGEVHDATSSQVALAWQLAKPFVSSVIIGASSLGQLEQNELLKVSSRMGHDDGIHAGFRRRRRVAQTGEGATRAPDALVAAFVCARVAPARRPIIPCVTSSRAARSRVMRHFQPGGTQGPSLVWATRRPSSTVNQSQSLASGTSGSAGIEVDGGAVARSEQHGQKRPSSVRCSLDSRPAAPTLRRAVSRRAETAGSTQAMPRLAIPRRATRPPLTHERSPRARMRRGRRSGRARRREPRRAVPPRASRSVRRSMVRRSPSPTSKDRGSSFMSGITRAPR
jgi:aryl-alcohol dehydrogenase-like predicted oxidoreductase